MTDDFLNEVTDEILSLLNRERNIIVFWVNSPIFSLPLIAINPADPKSSRIFALLDNEEHGQLVHKYSTEEILLWRLFVWDKLKVKQYAGTSVLYQDAIK